MRRPLGPLFANMVMSFNEKLWLRNCPSTFKCLLYQLYVKGCFLLFQSLDHVPFFFTYLDYKHPNISFTSELEKDGTFPFLDVKITRSNDMFYTSVYRKPTFTSPIFIVSFTSLNFNLSSSYEQFHTELEVVGKLFTSLK